MVSEIARRCRNTGMASVMGPRYNLQVISHWKILSDKKFTPPTKFLPRAPGCFFSLSTFNVFTVTGNWVWQIYFSIFMILMSNEKIRLISSVAPFQIWKWGHRSEAKVGGAPIRRKAPEKKFGRAPPLFGSKSTISRFSERFRDGQYSLVSFLVCCSTSHSGPVSSYL